MVKIGNGKLGPVELIIYKDDLFALKKVPKKLIDKPKRIIHLKSEKTILMMLKQIHDDMKSGVSSKHYFGEYFNLSASQVDDMGNKYLESTTSTS